MFKNVFLKYVTAFLLINFGSMLIMISIISSLIADYNTNAKTMQLDNLSNYVSGYINKEYVDSNDNSFDKFIASNSAQVEMLIEIAGINSHSYELIITDDEGNSLLAGGKADADTSKPEKLLKDGSKINPEIFEFLKSSDSKNYVSDLDGNLEDKYLFSKSAVEDRNDNTAGYVIACASLSGMDSLLDASKRTVIMSTLWITFAVLIASYFISERLVSPLREMSRAAREFADGRFDVRVPVRGSDEIAELASAFNFMASSLATNEETRRLFLANVSHDLRTPMTTISGFIDGILDGAIPKDQQAYYLEIVASEVKRLSRLVSAILNITQIQAGERKFVRTSFDICELCREIIISSVQRIEDKNLKVEFDCERDNMYVYADKDAIHQVIYNLVDNAIKFSYDSGSLKIEIKEESKKIVISVFNEGEGISKEDLPYVFDRFYKGDKSRGLDKTGTGLGLYIVRTIVEAHGEKITAESEKGSWSRFSFGLDKGESTRRKPSTADKE